MEGFKYVDIFATKGIEYIVAVVFLIALVMFWRWLNKPSVATADAKGKTTQRVSLVEWFKLADGFSYHQGHSWLHREEDDMALIGLDDFAQKLIGKPTKINLPAVGSKVRQGEKSIQLQIDDKMVNVLSPIDGEIVAVNNEVLKNPEIINQDPYEKGWLMKVRSDNLNSNMKNLLSGNIARAWIEDTVDKLSAKISGQYGVVLQDGGTITNGFVKELAPEGWEKIAGEFFLTNNS